MQDQAKKTLIGAFVVGALALGIGGVLAFGGGGYFEERDRYLVYFDGFVDGLEPGSPVMFRGVKIGEVESIRLLLDKQNVPVIEVVTAVGRREFVREGNEQDMPDSRTSLAQWIARGMRAQLGTVSLLTGQLKVDVDLFPNEPVRLRRLRDDLPEVPAIASSRERISQAIQSIPYETLAQALTEILTGIRDLVHSPDIRKTWDSLDSTIQLLHDVLTPLAERMPALLDSLDHTVAVATTATEDANTTLEELAKQAKDALEELNGLLEDYRTRGNSLFDEAQSGLAQAKGTIAKLDAEIEPSGASLRATLEEARILMKNLNEASGPGAPIAAEFRRALQKLSRALDAITSLAGMLERQPESILKGKSGG